MEPLFVMPVITLKPVPTNIGITHLYAFLLCNFLIVVNVKTVVTSYFLSLKINSLFVYKNYQDKTIALF